MDISHKSLEPMLFTNSTTQPPKQEQETNAEADILVESERQVSVLSTTTIQ